MVEEQKNSISNGFVAVSKEADCDGNCVGYAMLGTYQTDVNENG
jgi:hypothetical protein